MIDIYKLLDGLKDDIVDAGILNCVKKIDIAYPESPNPSATFANRYFADFQVWQGSMTYAIMMADLDDGKMRIEIDKFFNDIYEAKAGHLGSFQYLPE